MQRKPTATLVIAGIAFTAMVAAALTFYMWGGRSAPGSSDRELRVLAYSSFIAAWGPGPEIAKRFEQKTGVRVILQDAQDAGLILKKLELFPSDVVVGLDQLALDEARAARAWRKQHTNEKFFSDEEFVAFDYAPLAFVYRKSETLKPPTSLDDLLDARFVDSISLENPRTSSIGLQFLLWVIAEKGIEDGFKYFERLKPNIHTLASGWSSAYGVFQDHQAKLVLSYSTSPIYHSINDKSVDYDAAIFPNGQPLQIEFAGIPESCGNCAFADQFVQFLLEPEIQKLIMAKNYMYPIVESAAAATVFEKRPKVPVVKLPIELLQRRAELFDRFQKVGL